MLKYHHMVIMLAISLGALTGCREAGSASSIQGSVGNPEKGHTLFGMVLIGDPQTPGCATCHSLQPGKTIVGPSLAGVSTRAAQTEDANQFLRQSILEPDAIIAPSFASGVMYSRYANSLTTEQVDDLVAYLLTLK
jgi:mono/diheme cytochrome c family protein